MNSLDLTTVPVTGPNVASILMDGNGSDCMKKNGRGLMI